jgi:phospholipid transport system substrate-binding protein
MTVARSIVLTAVLAVWLAAPAAASPTEHLRQYTDEALRVLRDPALPSAEKRAVLRRLAEHVFDVEEAARRALGTHWRTLTPAQRAEFVDAFGELLERTYITRIDLYGGEQLRYASEVVEGEFAVVKARLVRRETEVAVEARLLRRDQRWAVYDVVIENVSLIANYRAQFNRIMRTESFEELMRRLRTAGQEPLRS